jgi:hypothetical protein|tara:strand:- start:294 stop:437 length:144 start_codon:yes stop_codon:yes gene_type:complete
MLCNKAFAEVMSSIPASTSPNSARPWPRPSFDQPSPTTAALIIEMRV